MADVMLSIRPKWCEMIASGKKTVEVRKTRPRQETPFKCYIYCTKSTDHPGKWLGCYDHRWKKIGLISPLNIEVGKRFNIEVVSGMVIGEFICDNIRRYAICGANLSDRRYREVDPSLYVHDIDLSELHLKQHELNNYGSGAVLFGWHISNLVIYDNPVPLAEFGEFGMKRPPQSWCYVKEVG